MQLKFNLGQNLRKWQSVNQVLWFKCSGGKGCKEDKRGNDLSRLHEQFWQNQKVLTPLTESKETNRFRHSHFFNEA
jgi:hypothetical protein